MEHRSYYVIKRYKSFLPSIVFDTESLEDAKEFAAIMHRTDGYEYSVLCDLF